MSEGSTENKMMNRIDDYKYHVVKFLRNPFKDRERSSCNHICVPRSWAKWHSPKNKIVEVWYPTENLCNIEEKVKIRERKSDQWESFFCTLEYSTDSYESAKWTSMKNNNKEDRTPITATVEKKTSKTTSSVIENEATVNSSQDALAPRVSLKSAKPTTFKRKTNDSDTSSHHKRSRENEPSESVDEVAGPSSQAIRSNSQKLTHKNSNGYQCMQEAPVVKSNDRNSTEQKQIITQNASTANYSLDPKIYATIFKCGELQKKLEERLGSSLVRLIIKEILKVDSDDDNNACGENDRGENDSGADDCYDEDLDEYACDDDIGLIDPIIEEVVPPKYNVNESEDHNKLFKTKSPQPIRKVAPKLDATDSNEDDLDDSGVDNEQRKKENNYPLPIKYDANKSVNYVGKNYNHKLLKTNRSRPNKKAASRLPPIMRKEDPDYKGEEKERRKKKRGPSGTGSIANVSSSLQQKTFVLPPEYDANSTRWTLKYQEPAEGLVELLKDSSIYVDASRLMDCQAKAKHSETLFVMLLHEVFTESALSTCTSTGKGFVKSGRPGLDEHAQGVILDFIAEQEKKVKWHTPDKAFLKKCLRDELKSIKNK